MVHHFSLTGICKAGSRLLGIGLVMVLVVGCGRSDPSSTTTPPVTTAPVKKSVVVTNSVLADFVTVVSGASVTVRTLVPENSDLRAHEMTSQNVTDVANADLVLSNGFGLEPWFDTFIKTADHRGPHVVVTDGVDKRIDAATNSTDPYAWVSPSNARIMIANVRTALAQISPDSATTFAANERGYDAQIDNTISYIQGAVAPVRSKRLVYVGEPLGYFCQQFVMSCTGVLATAPAAAVAASVKAANPVAVVFGPRVPAATVDAVKAAVPKAKITSGTEVLDVTSVGAKSNRHPSYISLERDIADLLSTQLL